MVTDDDAVSERETVPGMAEAIEARRDLVLLSAGGFAEAAGISRPIANQIRRGERRAYSDDTRYGVARALAWPGDWYQRIVNGEDPATFAPPPGVNIHAIKAAAAEILAATQRLLAAIEVGQDPPGD